MDAVLEGYARDAAEMIPHFEAVSSAQAYAPVAEVLPTTPCRILDVGAGTGRDAAWFAAQGHTVLAVEPVEALREAGRSLHGGERITWVDDRLPRLATLDGAQAFDRAILCAVWQHLDPPAREIAVPVLARLLAPQGRLAMSLRVGPGHAGRPVVPALPEDTIAAAHRAGLDLVLRREAPSVQPGNQAAGVTWTWLVFAHAQSGSAAPNPFADPAASRQSSSEGAGA